MVKEGTNDGIQQERFPRRRVAGRALHGRHIGSKGAPIHVEGNLNISENGDYDVTNYKTATVNIPLKMYTLNEILAGTSFYPVWVNAWVTCYPEYIINSADDNSISWTFRFRSSGMYHPQTADELVGIAFRPTSLRYPAGKARAESLSSRTWRERILASTPRAEHLLKRWRLRHSHRVHRQRVHLCKACQHGRHVPDLAGRHNAWSCVHRVLCGVRHR